MDEESREIVRQALQLDDAARLDYERAERQRVKAQPQQLVYKSFEAPAPQPQPTQQAAVMDDATQTRWDNWCDARIMASVEVVLEEVGKFAAEGENRIDDEIAKLHTEIATLRAELNEQKVLQWPRKRDVA